MLLTIACLVAAIVAAGISLYARKLRGWPRRALGALATLLTFLALLPIVRTLWWQLSSTPGLEKNWLRSPSFYLVIGALLASVAVWFMFQPARSAPLRSVSTAIILLLAVGTIGTSEKLISDAQHTRAVSLNTGLHSRTGQLAPDFGFLDLGGNHHTLSEYRGQVVLLNVWTTSCAPCIHEMPDLSAMQDRFAPAGFTLVVLSPDEAPRLQQFFATHTMNGIKARLLPTEPAPDFYHAYEAWPISFLIDRTGHVIDTWLGALPPEGLQHRIEGSL